MNSQQILFHNSAQESVSGKSPLRGGWLAICGFIFFNIVCYFVGAGMLRLVFPVTAFLVGVFLYWKQPLLYLGFTWWLWFLTPLAARLVDYRVGWDHSTNVNRTILSGNRHSNHFYSPPP